MTAECLNYGDRKRWISCECCSTGLCSFADSGLYLGVYNTVQYSVSCVTIDLCNKNRCHRYETHRFINFMVLDFFGIYWVFIPVLIFNVLCVSSLSLPPSSPCVYHSFLFYFGIVFPCVSLPGFHFLSNWVIFSTTFTPHHKKLSLG